MRALSFLLRQTILLLSCIVVTFVLVLPCIAQESETDSATTAFRKGRWLTGLSGSISSGSSSLDTLSNRTFTNQYAFDFSTGRFVKERWLLGGVLKMQRTNSRQFIELENESLLVAPLISYYLSDNPMGSIFISIAPGYARFREKTAVVVLGNSSQEELSGGGFGILAKLGYSYVLHDRIVFDLGLGLNGIWARGKREQESGQTRKKVKVQSGNILFSFGFNVLLGEFFF